MINLVAETLCRTANSGITDGCPYCIRGKCQPEMRDTFAGEARAVLAALRDAGALNERKRRLLPGLGG